MQDIRGFWEEELAKVSQTTAKSWLPLGIAYLDAASSGRHEAEALAASTTSSMQECCAISKYLHPNKLGLVRVSSALAPQVVMPYIEGNAGFRSNRQLCQ